jgi:hypothetical protein
MRVSEIFKLWFEANRIFQEAKKHTRIASNELDNDLFWEHYYLAKDYLAKYKLMKQQIGEAINIYKRSKLYQ